MSALTTVAQIFSAAVRELGFRGRRLRLAIAVLIVGFIGPFFSSALQSSVKTYLEERSRQILSADLAVTSTKPFQPSVLADIQTQLAPKRVVSETEFVTMAKGRDVSTLVEVKGVEPGFPIWGSFSLQDGAGERKVRDASALDARELAWVFPEVLAQLGLRVGDKLGVGKVEFEIAGVIADAPGFSRTGGFAPRVYVGRRFIEATGLTQFGAQVFHRVYLELPAGVNPESVTYRHTDPDLFTRTPGDAIESFSRFFSFFRTYLVTVSMIVFVLSWIAAFYILQIFLQERLKNAAVVMINGASRARVATLYSLQVFLAMLGAFAVAGLLVELVSAVVAQFFSARLPEGFALRVAWSDWLTLAAVAGASALAFNAPFFVRLRWLRLQTLLGENALGAERLPRATALLAYGPLVAVFLALSAWLMGSWQQSLRVVGGMGLAALLGWAGGRVLFRALFTLVRSRPGALRLVATSLSRSRFGVNLCFLALVLVSLALNLVPHLLSSVVSEMQPLQGRELPALFLFNVPESELDHLKAFAEQKSIELSYLSPLVLGRLLRANGQSLENRDLSRFPVRLSSREKRIPSETIAQGRDFGGRYDSAAASAPAEISVEEGYAERNGFHVGDVLDFDIQGVPIQGKVVNLRHVRWTSFNPNFFIMFQPGVLDDAPKTWIANVKLLNGTADAAGVDREKVAIQYALTHDFPDVTVIDVGRAITRGLEVAQSVIGPVRAAAIAAVAMSFLILIGVIAHNLRMREGEVDIEKLLGADRALIRGLLVGEYAVTAAFAWLVGALGAVAIAWAVIHFVLDVSLHLSREALLVSPLVVVLVTAAIAGLAATRVLDLRGTSRRL